MTFATVLALLDLEMWKQCYSWVNFFTFSIFPPMNMWFISHHLQNSASKEIISLLWTVSGNPSIRILNILLYSSTFKLTFWTYSGSYSIALIIINYYYYYELHNNLQQISRQTDLKFNQERGKKCKLCLEDEDLDRGRLLGLKDSLDKW